MLQPCRPDQAMVVDQRRVLGSSSSSTHTNATPDFGKIQQSKPISTEGVGTDAGLRRMRGSWALAMKSRVLTRRLQITIESIFATVRHRTKVTKGPGSKAAGLAMAFKLIEAAQARWRAVNAPHLVALVRAGARFEAGKLVERPDGQTHRHRSIKILIHRS